MKTIIIYASKYGCTADCARYLKTRLPGEVTVVDIQTARQPVDVSAYNEIIIGGSVYVGKITKKLQSFCESNLAAFKQKNVGIFLCAALSENFNEYLKANFPAQLLKTAKTVKLFGSEARLEKMKFMNKMMTRALTKGDYSRFKISHESMEEFVREMCI